MKVGVWIEFDYRKGGMEEWSGKWSKAGRRRDCQVVFEDKKNIDFMIFSIVIIIKYCKNQKNNCRLD